MSEQITQTSIDELVNSLSPEAKTILIKIGLNWKNIVGSFGSYVNWSCLEIAYQAKEPWSANKLTNKGIGRNGVVYELIPLLEKYNLVIKNINQNYTVYMLTDLGKEIVGAMINYNE